MRAMQVWDDASVMERSDRISEARSRNKTIHVADLMSICSIKIWETPSKRKHKGRVVFRGDNVKDNWGGEAPFGNLYSTPTNIQAMNIAIYFGMLTGHVIKVADAYKAYLQAMFLADADTFVTLPQELWKDSWRGRYKQPTMRLLRALYGHPRAGAFWDLHLRQVLQGDMGLIPIDGHPSVYFHKSWHLLIVVYVDDILAAGVLASQDKFWVAFRAQIQLDDVEDISQFLGRFHHLEPGHCRLDMVDYCRDAVSLYLDVAGPHTTLRKVSTPYVSEGILNQQDYEITGEIAIKASSVLMKLLWVCRLCRPDLAFCISMLAGQVSKWNRNCDKQLFRLVSYLNSTLNLCMHIRVRDPPEACTLDLYAGADLGGCPYTARSTCGLFLVVQGPGQSHGNHVNNHSLAEGMFTELLPALLLLQRLLGDRAPKAVADNSAVVQAVMKGYSIKLRHLAPTPKLPLASLNEACTSWCELVQTPTTEQVGDIFTKILQPNPFNVASLGLELFPPK